MLKIIKNIIGEILLGLNYHF